MRNNRVLTGNFWEINEENLAAIDYFYVIFPL